MINERTLDGVFHDGTAHDLYMISKKLLKDLELAKSTLRKYRDMPREPWLAPLDVRNWAVECFSQMEIDDENPTPETDPHAFGGFNE